MPRRAPDDARQAGSDIYLSWPGTIQRYDMRSRRVAASWTFDATGPTTLAGVVGSEPLSIAGGVARVGVRVIARGVHGMFRSGPNLWLTREERGQRYLEARPLASLAPQNGAHGPPLSIDRLIDAAADGTGLALFTLGSPPQANGLERRTVVESGPLRLTRGAGGAIEGALRVADSQGRLSWMPIDLSSGRFPFDVVRSIAVVGKRCTSARMPACRRTTGPTSRSSAPDRDRARAPERSRAPLRPRSTASANPATLQGRPSPADRAAA